MTPRERFDRLYNRIMRSAEGGDLAEARQFAPMAFAAYGQLDSIDADARYHVAVLYLHISDDAEAALRLADSIGVLLPRHLFATLIRGTVARQRSDGPALRKAETAFLADWEGELAAGRPEYGDHRTMLDEFRARARRDLGKPE